MIQVVWEKSVDAVIVGAGAAGMSAAVTAHLDGLDVLLIEKTTQVGGSTAISGGAVWLPLNAGSAAAGHPDSYERVWEYLSHTVGDAAPDYMKQAYLENGPAMLDFMTRHQVLDLIARSYSPDYYPDRPGAALGGRAMDPSPFDGRKLGRNFSELRNPLKEFQVLGGMMITLTDARKLLAATRSVDAFVYSGKLVLRYWIDRLRGYPRGTRLLLGNALAAQLFYAVLQRKVPYWLETVVTDVHQDGRGRVVGVTVVRGGETINIRVRKGLVIATGGFPWSKTMRDSHYPKPTGMWSMAPKDNRGEGIGLALTAGAALGSGHRSPAFWAPVSILTKPDGEQLLYPHLVWDRAKPGLIALDANGQRFTNEANSYHEFVSAMYQNAEKASAIPAYLVCDHTFIEKWGLGLALPGGRPRQHLVDAGYLLKATTLEQLAHHMSMDPTHVTQSIQRYNVLAEQGKDLDFGKGSTEYNRYLGDPDHQPNPCLAPLVHAPFYAVKVVAGDIGTAHGIKTDASARALTSEDQVIPGLYVAGNDMQSIMGGAYPAAGITLGPALTFGWVAGQQLVHDK